MEFEPISDEIRKRLRDPEVIRQQLIEGTTFQEILGFGDDQMERFYQFAYHLFNEKQYDKCREAFIFLTTVNPYVHNYWLGLGIVEQMRGCFNEALLAYAMAILTDMNNPLPHYHSASCYRAMGDASSAQISYRMAIRSCGNHPEFNQIREEAERALDR